MAPVFLGYLGFGRSLWNAACSHHAQLVVRISLSLSLSLSLARDLSRTLTYARTHGSALSTTAKKLPKLLTQRLKLRVMKYGKLPRWYHPRRG